MTDRCDSDALNRYLEDELSPEPRRRLGAHLRECASCRLELTELQGVVRLTQRLEIPVMSRFQAEALVHGVRRGVRQRYTSRWGSWTTSLGSAAAGAFALLLFLAAFDRLAGGESDSGLITADLPEAFASSEDAAGGGPTARSAMAAHAWSSIEVDPMADESDAQDAELISDIDEFLMNTASDEELLIQMESLVLEEALLALLTEY